MSFGDATWKSRTTENRNLGGGKVKPHEEDNMSEEKKNIKERLIDKVNDVKWSLIQIMDELVEEGFTRKASSLGTIIGDLERWQHTR